MINIYNWLLKVFKPFIVWWGGLHLPFTHKKITGKFYYQVRDSIRPGTALLTTTHGELSNLINPVSIKHAGIYIGKEGDGVCYVLEALGGGVVKTDLVTFLTTKDVVIAVEPTFLTEEDRGKVFTAASQLVGIPYDFIFHTDAKALYCFEAVIAVYKALHSELPYKYTEIVKGKYIYDHLTFMNDSKLFTLLFDSRKMIL